MAGKNGKSDNGEYIRVAGGYLEIRQKIGPGKVSATGKSNVVVSTGGYTAVEDSEIRVNLMAITKR